MIEKLESYKTKKNEYGKCIFKGQVCFYKIKDNILKEVEGYNKIKEYYETPTLLYYDDGIIIYKYADDLINNTLHEYLYFNKDVDISKVLRPYINSYDKRIVISEEESINKVFFKGRINKLDYPPLGDIIEETKKVLSEDKLLTCFLTQGDPTDTNISNNGMYTDFESAGYNSVIGEIAIMYASFITHGKYFYPKYNSLTYAIREDILSEYNKYKPSIDSMNVPKKNIDLMLSFLDIFKDDKIVQTEITKYLKYYLIMRMLSPIYINDMDELDREIIINYVKKIYRIDFNFENLKKLVRGEI